MDTNKKIVSIVDNEIDITVLFQDALCTKMKDFSVVVFNEPADALEHFKKIKKNTLVISDLRMPTMDGLQLLNKVKTEKYLNDGL